MEKGQLHIPINGVDTDFAPHTTFDVVWETDDKNKSLTSVINDINSSISANASNIANAANNISGLASSKANKATTLSGYGITDAYTKTEVNTIAESKANSTDVYTKTETDTELAKKLDLSGGNLSGKLTFSAGEITKTTTDSFMLIRGGTQYENGGTVAIYGKDSSNPSYAGGCRIICHNGTNIKSLDAYPNGNLTWGGKEIERVNVIGSNYIRYESGLQICFGAVSISTTDGVTVNFGASFSSTPSITLGCNYNSVCWALSVNNSSFNFKVSSLGSQSSVSGRYIAIGKWK